VLSGLQQSFIALLSSFKLLFCFLKDFIHVNYLFT